MKHFKKVIHELIGIPNRGLLNTRKSKYYIDQGCITRSKLYIFVEGKKKSKKVMMREWGLSIRCQELYKGLYSLA